MSLQARVFLDQEHKVAILLKKTQQDNKKDNTKTKPDKDRGNNKKTRLSSASSKPMIKYPVQIFSNLLSFRQKQFLICHLMV